MKFFLPGFHLLCPCFIPRAWQSYEPWSSSSPSARHAVCFSSRSASFVSRYFSIRSARAATLWTEQPAGYSAPSVSNLVMPHWYLLGPLINTTSSNRSTRGSQRVSRRSLARPSFHLYASDLAANYEELAAPAKPGRLPRSKTHLPFLGRRHWSYGNSCFDKMKSGSLLNSKVFGA